MPARSDKKGEASFSILGSDVEIVGDVKAEGDLHIDGSVKGDVSCNTLVIGESGQVNGGIEAEEARVAGAVDGTITGRQVTIGATAAISGDVRYDRISIEAGARIDGQLNRREASEALKLVAESGD